MVPRLQGRYKQERREHLNSFFVSIGVPAHPSRRMAETIQELQIYKNDNLWSIMTIGHYTFSETFKLGEQYTADVDEMLQDFQNMATIEGNILKIKSVNDLYKIVRFYEPTETGCIVTFANPYNSIKAKRVFVRV